MDKMFDIKITESIINQQEMFGTQSLAPIINQQDKMIEEFEDKINGSITGLDDSVHWTTQDFNKDELTHVMLEIDQNNSYYVQDVCARAE